MKLSVSEILTSISKLSASEEKINALRNNASDALYTVLKGALDPSIKWLLPKGAPPYKPNDLVDQQSMFYTEYKKLYLFIKGGSNIPKIKKETLFIQMLEALHKDDAQALIDIKDKKLNHTYKGLTENVVKESFNWNDNFMRK